MLARTGRLMAIAFAGHHTRCRCGRAWCQAGWRIACRWGYRISDAARRRGRSRRRLHAGGGRPYLAGARAVAIPDFTGYYRKLVWRLRLRDEASLPRNFWVERYG